MNVLWSINSVENVMLWERYVVNEKGRYVRMMKNTYMKSQYDVVSYILLSVSDLLISAIRTAFL